MLAAIRRASLAPRDLMFAATTLVTLFHCRCTAPRRALIDPRTARRIKNGMNAGGLGARRALGSNVGRGANADWMRVSSGCVRSFSVYIVVRARPATLIITLAIAIAYLFLLRG